MKKMILTAFSILVSASAFASTERFVVDPKSSEIQWVGTKVLVKDAHTGTIDLKDGYLEVINGDLSKADFIVKMNTIAVTDIKNPKDSAKLKGHLESEDFFDSAKFPEARLEITGSKKISSGGTHEISGILTIKGHSEKITFPATIKTESSKLSLIASLPVDRTKFKVKFGSKQFFENLVGNRIISDTFDLKVNLVASAQKKK